MTAVLPGQTTMFEDIPPGALTQEPLAVTITAKMVRTPRQRCANCGMRRICYAIRLGGIASSPALCAKCAGLR